MRLYIHLLACLLSCLAGSSFAQTSMDSTRAQEQFVQAMQLFQEAEHQRSLESLEVVIPFFQQQDDLGMMLRCQNLQAHNLLRKGALPEAETLIQDVLTSVKGGDATHQKILARTYLIQGEILLNKGLNQSAEQALQKSLSMEETSAAHQAQAYNQLGLVYWASGNWDLSLEYQQKALDIRQSLYGEGHPEVAASYNDMGLVYSTQENYQKALTFYQKARRIYEQAYGNNHPKLANAHTNLAVLYGQTGDFVAALEEQERALAIWESIYGNNHPNVAFAYSNLGQVHTALGNDLLAQEYQKQALEIYRENYGTKHPDIANTLNLIGNLSVETGDYEQALSFYQKALQANTPDFAQEDIYKNPDINNYYNAEVLLNSLLLKAQALEASYTNQSLKRKELTLALETLTKADQLIAKIRQLRPNKEDKIALGAIASEVYEDAIRICLALEEVSLNKNFFAEKAFYFSERSKAAVLLSTISDTQAKNFANIPRDLLEQEQALRGEITYYEQELAKGPDPTKEKEFRAKLFELNRLYTDFIDQLEQQFPAYYDLKYNIQTAEVEEIQQSLLQDAEVWSYFIANKTQRIYIFRFSQKQFKVLDVPQIENFEKYLISLRNAIRYQAKTTYIQSASLLHDQLFPKKIRKRVQKLMIIPDANLGKIPFEALLQKTQANAVNGYSNLNYLVKDFEISYAYSATLYLQNTQATSVQEKSDRGMLLYAPVSFRNSELSALPATATEVKRIAQLFEQRNQTSEAFLYQEAEEGHLKSKANRAYRYLHLATHGLIHESNPDLSQIYLASDSLSSEDGSLYAGEIYNLQLDADLVTLSACETGLGQVSKGEGIVGLSRAWLYAGAKNLVVSLWNVGDQSTSDFMLYFYENILEQEQDFSQALQRAKLTLIRHSQYSAPYHWAAFVLIGN